MRSKYQMAVQVDWGYIACVTTVIGWAGGINDSFGVASTSLVQRKRVPANGRYTVVHFQFFSTAPT